MTIAACGAPGANSTSCDPESRELTIATGSAGGVYSAFGTELASLISGNTSLRATAVETSSTLRNVQQLATDEYDIAFAQADSAADAVRGRGVFAEPQRLESLGRIHSDYIHVVVAADSGITTMADFRGHTISTGSPASGTELIADRLLVAAGLDPARDVTVASLDLAGTVAAVTDGSIDGFVWSGGLPTGAVADLFAQHGADLRFVDVSGLLPQLQEVNDVYAAGTIAADVYGTSAAVPTVVIPNLLLVRDDFPDDVACAVSMVLFDRADELARTVPAAAELSPQTATETAPVELSPGSETALSRLAG